MLDGAPIVCIATGTTRASSNRKTGDMIQTWVLRADVAPLDALASGADSSVCGQCPHRPAMRRASSDEDKLAPCYVEVGRAPSQVYSAYKRGRYPRARNGEFSGRLLRIGAYGDPAAVPFDVWERALVGTVGHTGYTHQWATGDKRLARVCMASADSVQDKEQANARGFRTFRIRLANDAPKRGEVVCPASDEGGKKLTCAQCGACNGTAKARRGNVVIIAH
jgi:hypothetical protein